MPDRKVISGATRVTGLIGDPVAHSLSPAMHNAAFAALELDFHYGAWRVPAPLLPLAVEGLAALGFAGFNVTVPHKVAVVPLLDGLDAEATAIGAVNTVVVEAGRLIGHNTDGAGFLDSLAEAGCDPGGRVAVLFGAGGAARAVAVALARARADDIVIVNRSPEAAVTLGRDLHSLGYRGRVSVLSASDPGIGPALEVASLVVNATTLGLGGSGNPVPPGFLREGQFVADIVYNPLLTPLLAEATARGCRIVHGDAMLLHQGARALTLWTGNEAPVEVMRAALRTGLAAVQEEFS